MTAILAFLSATIPAVGKLIDAWSAWKARKNTPDEQTGALAKQEADLEEKAKAAVIAAKKGKPDAFDSGVAS